jgi:hypothetical protein
MVVNLKMSDEIFEHYVKKYGLPKTYQRMKAAIEAFKDVDESDRYIFLHGEARLAIEAVVQTTIDDGRKLAKLIKNMSMFKIGGVEISFTDDELARLDMQATFHGRDRDTFVREMATEIKSRMLEQI